jgi:hypothetical protein
MNETLRDDPPEITTTEVRCPVCKARQPWSAACRRCRCDLTLLGAAAAGYFQLCRSCRQSLRGNRTAEALRSAAETYALYPSAESARLLAVCHFLREKWPAAATLLQGGRYSISDC